MRTLWTTLSLAGALLAGVPAIAQTGAPPPASPGGMRGLGGGGGLMRADSNGDGIITRAEATAQADQQFDRIDLNKDGKITAEERQTLRDQAMQRRAERSGETADASPPPPGGGQMGKRMDPDGDGAITREEYRTRALQRFDRMDTNHDGKIDAAEMAAIRQRMMDRRGDFGPMPTSTPPAPAATPKP